MFSRAVADGIKLNAWNTIPTPFLRYSVSAAPESDVTSRSPTRIDPLVGDRIPARHDSSVVFPQPLGPSSRTSSPERAVTSRPSIGRTT